MLKANDTIKLNKNEYRLVKPLKQGGQGEIWQIEDDAGEQYALKTVLTSLDDSFVLPNIENIRTELESLKRLDDPANAFIIPCLDSGTWQHERFGDIPAFVMPLMAGSLKEVADPIDGDSLLRWAKQIAQAVNKVQQLHGSQQLSSHRDLKPANVLLTDLKQGDVRLIDFGIAKKIENDLTRDRNRDSNFFAPEQELPMRLHDTSINGEEGLYNITSACDLYNLGLILYWLISVDRSLPSVQNELKDAALSKQHIEGISQGGAGLLGVMGGLTGAERSQLQRRLIELFGGNPDATLIMTDSRPLPDIEFNADKMADLVERLLDPDPTQRPTAAMAEAAFESLHQALKPTIEDISLALTQERIEAENPTLIQIRINGGGLPTHGKWFSLFLDGMPLPADLDIPKGDYLSGTAIWSFEWRPALEQEGDHVISLRSRTATGEYQADLQVTVSATSEQLWAGNRRKEAVELDPRKNWLDQMESEAATVRERVAFMDFIQQLHQLHPHNSDLPARLERLETTTVGSFNFNLNFNLKPEQTRLAAIGVGAVGGISLLLWAVTGLLSNEAPEKSFYSASTTEQTTSGGTPLLISSLAPDKLRKLQLNLADELDLPLTDDDYTFRDCDKCPTMAVLPAGEFQMGDTRNEGRKEELWQDGQSSSLITIKTPLAVAVTEITVDQFNAFVSDRDYHGGNTYITQAEQRKGCYIWGGDWQRKKDYSWLNPGFRQQGDHPVVCVGRNDIEAYARWLSSKTGRNYRLPTEAEWEYAARAGNNDSYGWGNTPPNCNTAESGAHFSNGNSCRPKGTAGATSYKPNAFGLYGMSGNVWEWSCSAYQVPYRMESTLGCENDLANKTGYAVRGGGWNSSADQLRSAARDRRGRRAKDIYTGFRLAVELAQNKN